MAKHLMHEVENLKRRILSLGAMVEENLSRAVRSVELRDVALAEKVIAYDKEIDKLEVDVEEEGLKILALHQPVAIDLRFIVAVLKINSDLERVGDLAANMAERAILLAKLSAPETPLNLKAMAEQVQGMLNESLDALVNLDADAARNVCKQDDEIDAANRETYNLLKEQIRQDPDHLTAYIHLLSTSRQLERIADHTTNIAEDVVYMVEGDIVRHRVVEQP
jgi:phosphate transport system protein